MSAHTIPRKLTIAEFPPTWKGHYVAGYGYFVFRGTSAPVAADEPAKGAQFTNITTGLIYINTGTLASPTWTVMPGLA